MRVWSALSVILSDFDEIEIVSKENEGEDVPALSVGRTLSEVEGYSVEQHTMKPERRGQAFRYIFFVKDKKGCRCNP